mmetsp:Transcript_10265/g.19407  ORF Transcript_10265/g.19407 Transcript_10265/m.19407 type:complete len:832 (+) Transcript_10265:132-2627(+)
MALLRLNSLHWTWWAISLAWLSLDVHAKHVPRTDDYADSGEEPGLCVCVLSYNRPALLRRTLTAMRDHLVTDEPNLNWSLAWVDNGSEEEHKPEMEDIRIDFGRDPLHPLMHKWFESNQGLAVAFNTLYFELCEGFPFVLTLEEDWLWNRLPETGRFNATIIETEEGAPPTIDKPTPAAKQALAVSMGLLETDDALVGVSLRGETRLRSANEWRWSRVKLPSDQATQCPANQAVDAAPAKTLAVQYRHRCMNPSTEGHVWGSYSNGGCLYMRSRLERVGRQLGHVSNVQANREEDVAEHNFPDLLAEANYAVRVGMHYCNAELRLDEGCELSDKCNHVLSHAGGGGLSTRNRGDSSTRRDPLRDKSLDTLYVSLKADQPTRPDLVQAKPAPAPPLKAEFYVKIAIARRALEGGVADVLDELERECIKPEDEPNLAYDTSPDSELPELPSVAALKNKLKGYYKSFGSFDRPAQPVTWNSLRAFSMLHAMVRSQGRSQSTPPVTTMDQYMNLAHYASDVAQFLSTVQYLVTCPAPTWNGLVVTHFFASQYGSVGGDDKEAASKELEIKVAQLENWVESMALHSHLQGLVVYSGLEPHTVEALSRPNVDFVEIGELITANTTPAHGQGSPMYLQHLSVVRLIQSMEQHDMSPDALVVMKFEHIKLERDPLKWVALLERRFDLFSSCEAEGYLPSLFESFQVCFGDSISGQAPVIANGAYYTPHLIAGKVLVMKQFHEAMLEKLDLASKLSMSTRATHSFCELAAHNWVLWDNVLERGIGGGHAGDSEGAESLNQGRWRLFSGPPFTAPFNWAKSPVSDTIALSGKQSVYGIIND